MAETEDNVMTLGTQWCTRFGFSFGTKVALFVGIMDGGEEYDRYDTYHRRSLEDELLEQYQDERVAAAFDGFWLPPNPRIYLYDDGGLYAMPGFLLRRCENEDRAIEIEAAMRTYFWPKIDAAAKECQGVKVAEDVLGTLTAEWLEES